MIDLTAASILSRKAFISTIAGILIIIFSIILFIVGRNVARTVAPQSALPQTVAFGKLPKIDFSEGVAIGGGYTFRVETISGELPSLSSNLKVFRVIQPERTLGGLDKAKDAVSRLGFKNEPEKLSEDVYKFTDPQDPSRVLTIDITTADLNYTTDWRVSSDFARNAPADDQAKKIGGDFVRRLGLNTNEFSEIEVEKLHFETDKLTTSQSKQLTNVLKVNFSRKEIDKIPVFNINGEEYVAEVLIVDNKVVSAEVGNIYLERNSFATYPLKGTTLALEDLESGLGVFDREPLDTSFRVKNIQLGYLESKNNNGFVQPVYVFEDFDGVNAFVPAVDSTWLK